MNVRFVHALCAFPCDRCKGEALTLALAPVNEGGVISGDAQRPATGPLFCAACRKADRDAEEAEYKRQTRLRRQQKKWAAGDLKESPRG